MLPRILIVHNRYQQAGGEDSVFTSEVGLLRAAGCEVETLEVSNDEISGLARRATAAFRVIYNNAGRRKMADAIKRVRPDLVHVHNFFPLLSPAIFDACAVAGVPAVWTLHNFRVACANGLLFRDGRPCEDCIGKIPLFAIKHRCYRGSTLGSAAVATMIAYHRGRGTWDHQVTRFIALTDFARDLVIRAGLPADRVMVKANALADPLPETDARERAGALFLGRLSSEKGARTMIDAWRSLPEIPLTIVGDGPERTELEQAAPSHVRFLGFQQRTFVLQAMASARALIVPSTWYENFPMAVVEAMALGTPVIASRIGALQSIITDRRDGLHFAAGDKNDLAQVVAEAFGSPDLLNKLGVGARQTWHATMAPDRNVARLLSIYREAMAA